MIKAAQAPPPAPLARPLERLARRLVQWLDAAVNRAYGWRWNPWHQAGTLAVAMLLVLLASGLYLVLFYRVGAPYPSVARLAQDPWLGSWMRSLHRYATDVFVLAAAAHALRLLAQSRSFGPRTLAWISGVFLLGTGLVCAWTGYVMVWDSFGERLALEGARLFDALPFFSEPLRRIFAGDGPVPSAFFFVNLFLHLAVPLAIGVALWVHVSRLARPVLLPPRRLLWGTITALTLAAVVLPAALGPAADPFRLARVTATDLLVAWWLPLSEALPPGVSWAGAIGIGVVFVLIPRLTRRPRRGSWAVSTVDSRLCTGCNQCPQDCPWEAITMVARNDGRETLLAQVDPTRCVSCGLCAGSCAPMGVGPPGRSGRDQLASLRGELIPQLDEGAVVALCCSQAPERQLDAIRARGFRVQQVTCGGNLHSSVIELLLRSGARGVVVGVCPPRDCVGREGPKWLDARLYHEREAELQARVERRRVRVITLAPGASAEMRSQLTAFMDELATLGGPDRDSLVQLENECTPVPLESEVA